MPAGGGALHRCFPAAPSLRGVLLVIPRRYWVYLWVTPLVCAGLAAMALLDPDPGGNALECVGIGYFLGTMFGQATLAAAWAAFGPAPLLWRVPLSLGWIGLLVMALALNIGLHRGPGEAALVIGLCLLGQWLLVQIPLWCLALGYGLHLRHVQAAGRASNPRDRQFGIRQLMILTTVVGVLLGLGRLAVSHLAPYITPGLDRESPIFIFLGVAAIVVTLPLILAALLPRLAVPAVLVVLVVAGLMTAWEIPLLGMFHRGPGPNTGHVMTINAFTAAWILAIVVAVRLCGYRLGPTSSGEIQQPVK
jgi:hypothetical protein